MSLTTLPNAGFPFYQNNGMAASPFAMQPFNNPNYQTYYSSNIPNFVPQRIIPQPSQFQEFVKFVLMTFNKKLQYTLDILSQLWNSRNEFENSYRMDMLLDIFHTKKQVAVALTTLQGKGTEVPPNNFKQVRVKPADYLAYETSIPSYDFNSQSENVKRTYLLNILEGIMMQTRRLMLMTAQGLFECYNFLDHLQPQDLMELVTYVTRGVGILNRSDVDVMIPIQYLADSIRIIMAYHPVDLIFGFYPQQLQQTLVKANCWKYSSGEQLLQENMVVPQFIQINKADNDMLGDGGTLRLISNPSTGKFSKIEDNLETFVKIRKIFFIKVSDLLSNKGVYIEIGGGKYALITKAWLEKNASAGGPANPSDDKDVFMFIPQTMIINGNPIVLAGTGLPGTGYRPLQAIEGHLSSIEGEVIETETRWYKMKKSIRIHPAFPDIVRLIGSAYVRKIYMGKSSCVASRDEDMKIFIRRISGEECQALKDNVSMSTSDYISWNTLSSLLGLSINSLVSKNPDFIESLSPIAKDEPKLYVSVNLSNSQTGCLMSDYALGTGVDNKISIPTSMNATMEGLIPVLLNKALSINELRSSPVELSSDITTYA